MKQISKINILGIIGLLFLLFCQITYAQSQPNRIDISSKATNIARFASQVNWPSSMVGSGKDFTVGVIGDASVADIMGSTLNGLMVRNRKIEVKHFATYEDIRPCPIVFLSTTSTLLPSTVFRSLANRPILVITERDGYLDRGGDINFVNSGGTLRFEVNPPQIKAKGLGISQTLTNEAVFVKENKVEVSIKKNPETGTSNPNNPVDDFKRREELKRLREAAIEKEKAFEALIKSKGLSEKEEQKMRDSLNNRISLYDAQIKQSEAEQRATRDRNKLLEQTRQTEIANTRFRTAILLAIVILASSLALLFFYFSQRRKRIIDVLEQTRNQLATKVDEVNLKNDLLEKSSKELEDKNKLINIKNDQLTEQTEELEEQNRKITDSIRYAMTIQLAMLPTDKQLKATFNEYFIIYQPKDIVSGDFYWLSRQEGKTFVAVVDCTGHGVPGAFMSAIGSDLLNEIVNEKRIFSPGRILEMLHLGIYERLRQGDSNNRDGMDVCFCTIAQAGEGQSLVTFAGAKRPLYYSQNKEFKRIGGDSKYIGGILKERQAFHNHEILLDKGDVLYLTSDGYTDAPNAKRIKYGTQRFFDLLAEHSEKPLEIQKQILENELKVHQIDTDARDDVTIMGIRI